MTGTTIPPGTFFEKLPMDGIYLGNTVTALCRGARDLSLPFTTGDRIYKSFEGATKVAHTKVISEPYDSTSSSRKALYELQIH